MYSFIEKKLNIKNFWQKNIYKTLILILVDFILIFLSLITTIFISSDNKINYISSSELHFVLINIFISIPIYFLNNQYKIISRFLGSKSAYKIILNSFLMINKKDSSGFTNSVKTFITYGVGAFIGVLIVRVIKAIIFS